RYLADLLRRLPHADVHRFEGAGHLLPEDADVAGTIAQWLTTQSKTALSAEKTLPPSAESAVFHRPLSAVLEERRDDDRPAVIARRPDDVETATWRDLATRVRHLALGLHDSGVRPGQRVSLLITPGVDLTTALFACLRLGAIAVIADQGLGLRGMSRAVRGAAPDVVIGIERGLAGARMLSWPGRRISATDLAPARARALGADTSIPALIARGADLDRAGTALPPV